MTSRGPLFSYYGAKWRMAKWLGPPQRGTIIEPFAGSACYSVYWGSGGAKVILLDTNPTIVAIWRYLIRVKESEIMALPVNIRGVDEMRGCCQEAKWLVGFWCYKGSCRPGVNLNRTDWPTMPWSAKVRSRIASFVKHTRRWKVIEGDYRRAPDIDAHWHIDPPYENKGRHYIGGNALDYQALGEWCRARKGYVQVCEHSGANWLPFVDFTLLRTGWAHKNRSQVSKGEAVYTQGRPALTLFDEGEDHDDSALRNGAGDSQGNRTKAQKGRRPASSAGRDHPRHKRRSPSDMEPTERRGARVVQRKSHAGA
jgi:hypothetical protein